MNVGIYGGLCHGCNGSEPLNWPFCVVGECARGTFLEFWKPEKNVFCAWPSGDGDGKRFASPRSIELADTMHWYIHTMADTG